jgi:hypothetical protein
MDNLLLTSIFVGSVLILGIVLYTKNAKSRPNERPGINIDFDTAKEREDKNRYFS